MSEKATDLQYALDNFSIYCNQWRLKVNVNKTKILVFSKGSAPKTVFRYDDNVIETVKDFNNLGIIFSTSGSFCKAKTYLAAHAQKAMYGIIKKIRLYDLSIECQLDLFDKGCQIFGMSKTQLFILVNGFLQQLIKF